MAQDNVELLIPFESLVDSVTKLRLKDKFRLWELLEEQMAYTGEEAWEEDPTVQAEIREARGEVQKKLCTLCGYFSCQKAQDRNQEINQHT